MTQYIKEHLGKFPINIDTNLIKSISRLILQFEIRDQHPNTLNSNVFGVHKFIFTSQDKDLLFDMVGIDPLEFNNAIKDTPSINNAFKVTSDPFNMLCITLVHHILNSKLSHSEMDKLAISILNYLQYRIFSSAVNHYFPYKADYDVMQTVVESLNFKFAIKQLHTWKAVIISRSTAVIDKANKSSSILKRFDNDKDILYVLTDISTRIRSQLKIITAEYYKLKEAGNVLGSHSSTTTLDGEKIIRESNLGFANISSSVYYKARNKTSFIDNHYLNMVQKSVPRLNINVIRRTLQALSDEIITTENAGSRRKIIRKSDGTEYYYGCEELISRIVYTIYNSAIHNPKVNLRNKITVYVNTKNIYSAARSSDPVLLNVKYSIGELIKRTRITRRDNTISGLIIAVVLYITLISFEKI